jgi:hypothetical protein
MSSFSFTKSKNKRAEQVPYGGILPGGASGRGEEVGKSMGG